MKDQSRIKEFPIDIMIVTSDRLPYLQKCIWSIIASTQFQFKIHVIDDCSSDGTHEWLTKMVNRGLIETVLLNDSKQGTAENFNHLIENYTDSEFVCIANDDMYFHRDWDYACADIIQSQVDVGAISFFNYSVDVNKILVKRIDSEVLEISVSGLGASMLNVDSFKKAGQFKLPKGKLMGYFTTPFCGRLKKLKSGNRIFATMPHFATNMDTVDSPLKEFQHVDKNGYFDFRAKEKNFISKNRKNYKEE